MLLENDVIDYVECHLKSEGYHLVCKSDTNTHGHDLVMEKDGRKLYVEAKGQTSSKERTNRYGKEFTRNQKWDHVSKAVYTSMKTQNLYKGCDVGIALPSDNEHSSIVDDILPSLEKLGIKVFLVSEDGKVIVK